MRPAGAATRGLRSNVEVVQHRAEVATEPQPVHLDAGHLLFRQGDISAVPRSIHVPSRTPCPVASLS
jgi:hypothetical protein